MGHPWLWKAKRHWDGEASCPDSEIVAAMKDNGFDTQDIKQPLIHKILKKPWPHTTYLGSRHQDNRFKQSLRNQGWHSSFLLKILPLFPCTPHKRGTSEPSFGDSYYEPIKTSKSKEGRQMSLFFRKGHPFWPEPTKGSMTEPCQFPPPPHPQFIREGLPTWCRAHWYIVL